MCGIVGLASTEGKMGRQKRSEALTELLMVDSLRGWESTGLACIVAGKEREEPQVYKRAVCGYDFVQLKKAGSILSNIDDYSILIGHNRAATRGSVNDANAHPFQYDHITLVHNGTIHNYNTLQVDPGVPVDSAHVAMSMAMYGVKETLEKIIGGFVLVWHDSRDGTLNIARNDSKPLVWGFEKQSNTMYFGSELETLWAIMARKEIKLDGKFKVPAAYLHYKFDTKDLRKYTSSPFVQARLGNTHPSGASGMNGRDGFHPRQTRAETSMGIQIGSSSNVSNIGTDSKKNVNGDLDLSTELDEIRADLREVRSHQATGRPTSIKRLKRARDELAKFGLRYDMPGVVKPLSYTPYKNQRDYGSISGYLKSRPNIDVIVNQVRESEKNLYFSKDAVYIRIVNVRGSKFDQVTKEHKVVCVAVQHERQPGDPVNLTSTVGPQEQKAQQHWQERQRQLAEETLASESPQLIYRGPNLQMVSAKRFKELTSNGCGNCQSSIFLADHNKLVWIGDTPSPICWSCQNDKDFKKLVGFEPSK